MLGALPACTSALVNSVRSLVAIRYKSFRLGLVMIAINLALGIAFVRSPWGWLPVIASAITTYAMFNLQGVPFRIALLCSTLLWLGNDVLTGSIGGTVLEMVTAGVNIFNMVRLSRTPAAARVAVSSVSE